MSTIDFTPHPSLRRVCRGVGSRQEGEAIEAEYRALAAKVAALEQERDEARRMLDLANSGRAQLDGWRDALEQERDALRTENNLLGILLDEVEEAINGWCGFAFEVGRGVTWVRTGCAYDCGEPFPGSDILTDEQNKAAAREHAKVCKKHPARETEAALAASQAEAAELRKALERAASWMRDPEHATEQFEEIAEMFYRDTGILRPGKSYPLPMSPPSDEERYRVRHEWCDKKSIEVLTQARAALALLPESK